MNASDEHASKGRHEAMYSSFDELDKLSQVDYEHAFLAIQRRLSKNQICMLKYHYNAPNKTVAPSELASLIGYKSVNVVNSQYGTVGSYLCREFNLHYKVKINTLVHFEDRLIPPDQYLWIMRNTAFAALQRLHWFVS